MGNDGEDTLTMRTLTHWVSFTEREAGVPSAPPERAPASTSNDHSETSDPLVSLPHAAPRPESSEVLFTSGLELASLFSTPSFLMVPPICSGSWKRALGGVLLYYFPLRISHWHMSSTQTGSS